MLDGIEAAQAEGIDMYGQVPPRATGILMGLTATLNPFLFYPSFQQLAALPLEEKVKALSNPEMKEKILSEEPVSINPLVDEIVTSYNKMFRLGDPANYEPDPEDSFLSEAKREGKSPQEVADYYYKLIENSFNEFGMFGFSELINF